MSSATSSTRPLAGSPRPSASLIIVNSRNEILLVQRNLKSKSFAGVHVFPGGNADPEDKGSRVMTAIRETFEESGLLLASPKSPQTSAFSTRVLLDSAALSQARHAIINHHITFDKFLDDNNLSADTHKCLPFTQWVTPPKAPTRFHAHFFVTFLPSPLSSSSTEFLPTPDSGQEVLTTRFVHPRDALAQFNAQKISFMPPQFYLIRTLADILRGPESTQYERDLVTALSEGPFGHIVVNPRLLHPPPKGTPEGYIVLTYEGDESRGGPPGRLHRIECKNDPSGHPISLNMHRNFDVFSKAEYDESFSIRQKL